MERPVLETHGLTIRFGGHVAVDGVSCAFAPGTLTAIVGPNGAGKTTYFNLISGQLKASAGRVSLYGEDITRLSPPQRTHRGIGGLRGQEPNYMREILEGPSMPIPGMPGEPGDPGVEVEGSGVDGEQDPLYDQAVRIVIESRKASISGVQRRLKIGYNRAARMIETMEAAGLVGPLQSNGMREVLAPAPPEE